MTTARSLSLLLLAALLAAVPAFGFLIPQQMPGHQHQQQRQSVLAREDASRCLAHRSSGDHQHDRSEVIKGAALTALGAGLAAMGLGPVAGALAAEGEGQSYSDDKYKVSFSNIPSDWPRTDTRVGTDELDFRKLVVFKDPKSPANVFVAYTPVQPDFATLGSFGSILDVAKTIVPQGRGIKSKLLKYESKNGYYTFDYVLQPDRQPERHLVTIFALVPGEVLITYTTNCLSEQYEALGPVLDKITSSFKIGSI